MTAQQIDSEGFIKRPANPKQPPQQVTVTDIDISFGSLIGIMFKAMFAAIVVGLTIGAVGFFFSAFFMMLLQQMHK